MVNTDAVYYSPLSYDGVKERLRQGRVGEGHEVCLPSKRKECDRELKCTASVETRDPNCYKICRGVSSRELV